MYSIKKRLSDFCAAHRLINHYEGKCKNLHGHNYKVYVTIEANELNPQGFVIDFSSIKNRLDPWIKEHLDHSVIVNSQDFSLIHFLKAEQQKYFILPSGQNPTVENISSFLFKALSAILHEPTEKESSLKLKQIEIWETDNASAIYEE